MSSDVSKTDLPHTALAKVKVETNTSATIDVNDTSNSAFKIKGNVNVTVPNTGNEIWYVNGSAAINWTANGTVNPVMADAIASLTDLPVDIEPVYPLEGVQ